MKKMIAFCLLFSISAATFSQADTSIVSPMKTDYLKKSKNQKTAAWILLGGGFSLGLIGSLVSLHGAIDFVNNQHEGKLETGGIMAIAGGVAMLGSIPLFISASHNKHKAMSITFNNDFVPQLRQG